MMWEISRPIPKMYEEPLCLQFKTVFFVGCEALLAGFSLLSAACYTSAAR